MLYLTSTILIALLQSTLTTITAMEHFAAVPGDKHALLPHMEEIPGGVGIDKSVAVTAIPRRDSPTLLTILCL
jgi:hypothetical protein